MIDLLIVLAFVAYSITAGFRAKSKASKNLVQYFLAGRTIAGWKAGFSMAATQYAADTPLLVMGLIASGGIFMLWRLWIYGLAFLLMGFILGEILEQRLRESLSLGEGNPVIFLTRPISMGIILLTVSIVVVPLVLDRQKRKRAVP